MRCNRLTPVVRVYKFLDCWVAWRAQDCHTVTPCLKLYPAYVAKVSTMKMNPTTRGQQTNSARFLGIGSETIKLPRTEVRLQLRVGGRSSPWYRYQCSYNCRSPKFFLAEKVSRWLYIRKTATNFAALGSSCIYIYVYILYLYFLVFLSSALFSIVFSFVHVFLSFFNVFFFFSDPPSTT